MANTLVNEGKYELLKGTIGDITSGTTIKLALVKTTSGFSSSTTYGDVAAASGGTNIITSSIVSLGSKTVTNNVFDAADPTITGVPSGITVNGYIIYFDNGSSKKLLGWVDTGTGISFTTNGGNITITFSVSGIFAL